jgi:hypothetical protein
MVAHDYIVDLNKPLVFQVDFSLFSFLSNFVARYEHKNKLGQKKVDGCTVTLDWDIFKHKIRTFCYFSQLYANQLDLANLDDYFQ